MLYSAEHSIIFNSNLSSKVIVNVCNGLSRGKHVHEFDIFKNLTYHENKPLYSHVHNYLRHSPV